MKEESVESRWTSDVAHKTTRAKLIFLKQEAAYRFACGYVKGRTVLDIGCGSGYGTNLLSLWADIAVGIDQDETAIEYCRERYPRDNLTFLLKSSGAYDVVTCFQVIEHVEDDKEFVKKLRKCATDTLIISTPNPGRRWLRRGNKPWNPEHCREYYEDEFRKLLTSAFSSVQIAGIHGSPDADLLERMRTSSEKDVRVPLRRWQEDEFTVNDFSVGPAEGCLDLLAVCQ